MAVQGWTDLYTPYLGMVIQDMEIHKLATKSKDDRDTSALYTLGLAELVSVRRPDSNS